MGSITFVAMTLFVITFLSLSDAEEQPGESVSVVVPADKNASSSVRTILHYMTELSKRKEKKLMTGQFLGWHPDLTMEAAEAIQEQSGEWVAIIGVDYYETKLTDAKRTEPEFWKPPRWKEINPLLKAYWSEGGLTTISVHMTNPYTGEKAWDTSKRGSDELFDSETQAGKAYLNQINGIADGIEDLQQAGVVVLYRPFHEWDGGWFWWGGLEAELAQKLWQHMFHHFTETRGLHNIIWVYNGGMQRYPGDAYVDINSCDYYDDYEKRLPRDYEEMRSTGKLFAVAEFGPSGDAFDPDTPRNYDYSPFAKKTINAGPGIVYFLAWRDAWGLHRNPGTTALMNDPLVINRDDLAQELFPKLRETGM